MRAAALIAAVAALAVDSAALAQSQLDPYESLAGAPEAVEVVNGDVLIVAGTRVRLYGIDAPDPEQPCESRGGQPYDCGRAARNVLTMLTRGRDVDCTIYAYTSDGVAVGRCFAGDTDIGLAMIRGGWAFPHRSLSNRYESAEARAQAEQAGFWSGRVQRPWIWRARRLANSDD